MSVGQFVLKCFKQLVPSWEPGTAAVPLWLHSARAMEEEEQWLLPQTFAQTDTSPSSSRDHRTNAGLVRAIARYVQPGTALAQCQRHCLPWLEFLPGDCVRAMLLVCSESGCWDYLW